MIEEYCRKGVSITRALFYHECDKGHVAYMDRGKRTKLEVDLATSLDRIPTELYT